MRKQKLATPLLTLIMISGVSFFAFGCGPTATTNAAVTAAAPSPKPTAAAAAPATTAGLIANTPLPSLSLTSQIGAPATSIVASAIAGTYNGTITEMVNNTGDWPMTFVITQVTQSNQTYLAMTLSGNNITSLSTYITLVSGGVSYASDIGETIYSFSSLDPTHPVSIFPNSFTGPSGDAIALNLNFAITQAGKVDPTYSSISIIDCPDVNQFCSDTSSDAQFGATITKN